MDLRSESFSSVVANARFHRDILSDPTQIRLRPTASTVPLISALIGGQNGPAGGAVSDLTVRRSRAEVPPWLLSVQVIVEGHYRAGPGKVRLVKTDRKSVVARWLWLGDHIG